jgi:hypothetical protein
MIERSRAAPRAQRARIVQARISADAGEAALAVLREQVLATVISDRRAHDDVDVLPRRHAREKQATLCADARSASANARRAMRDLDARHLSVFLPASRRSARCGRDPAPRPGQGRFPRFRTNSRARLYF